MQFLSPVTKYIVINHKLRRGQITFHCVETKSTSTNIGTAGEWDSNPSKDGKMLPAWFLDFKRPVTDKGVYQLLGRVLPDAAGYPILEV